MDRTPRRKTPPSPASRLGGPRARVPTWAFVLAVALGVRLAYLLTARGPAFDAPLIDADYYDYLGERLARGEGFDPGPFWQPPLYPLVLGGLYWLGGHSLWWPRLFQALLGALTAALACGVARRVSGNPRVGLSAGLLVALHGPLVFYDGELLATSLGTFLGTAALWLAIRESPGVGTAPLCGACIGLGALAVSPLLLLVLPLAVALGWGRPVRAALCVVACAAVVLCATSANRARSGEWVLISANGGINLWLGNNQDVDGAMAIRPGAAWEALVNEPARRGFHTPATQDAYFIRKTLDWCRSRPLDCVGNLLWKARLLLVARELPRNEDLSVIRSQSPVVWALTARAGSLALPYALLWPLAAVGAVGLWRRWRAREDARVALTVAGAALMLAAPSVLFFVTGRYRAPLAPALCVLAALGLHALLSRASPRAVPAGVALAVLVLSVWPVRLAVDTLDFEAELHYAVGGRHARLGNDAAAVEAWRRAVLRKPDYLEAGYNLGLALERLGRTGEAARTYESLLRWYPREGLLRERLALLQGAARDGGP
ncbi:glycosyltransferase family 39 protein [Archangium sp.]|uniref:glycosyltransferase family 39 protein n=1 Tax=Archangium sp. TaxID=1872627 RepID=UPI002D4FF624|nr:glycosyltransferase family 39 protein [Archangium sp.]HYO59525.1 glycosyltransferase family 39 protein [Archangium sp.]